VKWNPQPKDPCGRPDCNKEQRELGFCLTHVALFRRNGAPYRQDELAEMRDSNKHQTEMDAALEEDPPIIQWIPNGKGVLVGYVIHDPHEDHPNHKPRKPKGLRSIDIKFMGEVS